MGDPLLRILTSRGMSKKAQIAKGTVGLNPGEGGSTEVRERIRNFIAKIDPYLEKGDISRGVVLPLISHAESSVKDSEECYALGITHSLYGLGTTDEYVRRHLEEARKEGRMTLGEELEARWVLTDFVDDIRRKVIENLEKCKLG